MLVRLTVLLSDLIARLCLNCIVLVDSILLMIPFYFGAAARASGSITEEWSRESIETMQCLGS